ncbi:MAG TPA: hypothetical protein VHE53_05655 [Patescibacteria group bacterium]|nr:hypothetical protein [Patescibacteria group bacterium]
MAKKSTNNVTQDKTLMIVVLLIVGFLIGFLVARARYKPQIMETYNIVQEQKAEISDLKLQISAYKAKIMMDSKNTK